MVLALDYSRITWNLLWLLLVRLGIFGSTFSLEQRRFFDFFLGSAIVDTSLKRNKNWLIWIMFVLSGYNEAHLWLQQISIIICMIISRQSRMVLTTHIWSENSSLLFNLVLSNIMTLWQFCFTQQRFWTLKCINRVLFSYQIPSIQNKMFKIVYRAFLERNILENTDNRVGRMISTQTDWFQ